VVVRGANAPDVLPRNEGRLEAEIARRYGPERSPADVAEAWRPYRSWAAVHLRALRERPDDRPAESSGDGSPATLTTARRAERTDQA
jgi:DNA-3-methyladenine glycosylase II